MLKSTATGFVLLGALLSGLIQVGLCENSEYRIQHYDLWIEPDFTMKSVSLTVAVSIENPSLKDSFTFGLNDRYESVIVTSASSASTIERGNGSITVKLTKPSAHLTLVFRLSGTLGKSVDEDREIVSDSSLFLLWSDRFYPIDFDHWATVRTEISLPAAFQVIAPGKTTSVETIGSKVIHVFETARPAVSFSVFADSRWIKTEREINGIRMQTLLHPESQKFSEQIFRTSSEILKFYSETFSPFPFDQFSFVTISGIYARRAFPGFVGYQPRYLEKEFTTTGHDAHETVLLWWGYTTRGDGPGSFQWTEGFGDYGEILYDHAYNKPIPSIFQRFHDEYLALPAEQDVSYSDLRGNTPQKIVHGKYPWLMHLVRYVVGDSAFNRAMKLVFGRFQFRTFSMNEFISTLEEGCGQPLQWWREEWLERKGIPEIAMSSQVQSADSGYSITCTLEQHGSIYHLPLEIGIESREGIRVEKVKLSQRQDTFTFESREQPTRVLLDPNGWVLMKVRSTK